MSTTVWEIIGGGAAGGILVRENEDLSSKSYANRLSTGSLVEEVRLKDDRLHYCMISGSGPYQGWVSIRTKERILAIRQQSEPSAKELPESLPEFAYSSETKTKPSVQTTPPSNLRCQENEIQTQPSTVVDARKSSNIRVCAFSVSGKSVEVHLARDCTTGDLRKRLAKIWLYPADCLKVVLEGTCLTDDEQLHRHCDEYDALISVTVVISLDELYSCLEEARPPTSQVMAMRKLVPLVPHGCERTFAVLANCLDSKAPSVRQEAVQALLTVVGAESTRAEVEARFGHEDLDVRMQALRCWPFLLAQDEDRNTRILSTMSPFAEDSEPKVRKVALDIIKTALDKKFQRGDQYLVELAQAHLKKYRSFNTDFWSDMLWATVDFAKKLFLTGHGIFVDARGSKSFEATRIPRAWLLSTDETMDLGELAVHPAVRAMREQPESAVVVYSDTGSPMSRCVMVASRLRHPNFRAAHRIFRLIGGLNFWKLHSLPVEGDARFMYAGEFYDGEIRSSEMADLHMAWVH